MTLAGLLRELGQGLVVERVPDCRLVAAVAGQRVQQGPEPAPRQPGPAAVGPEQVPQVLSAVDSKVAFDLAAVPGQLPSEVSSIVKGMPITFSTSATKSRTCPLVGLAFAHTEL